jgi:hypothetical protein
MEPSLNPPLSLSLFWQPPKATLPIFGSVVKVRDLYYNTFTAVNWLSFMAYLYLVFNACQSIFASIFNSKISPIILEVYGSDKHASLEQLGVDYWCENFYGTGHCLPLVTQQSSEREKLTWGLRYKTFYSSG